MKNGLQPMQTETTIKTTWRPICPELSELLRRSCNQHTTRQEESGGDARRNRAIREIWPGASFGIRAPERGETPLSRAEVEFIIDRGIFL